MDGRPASPLSVLAQHRDFRRLLAGNSVSLLGSGVTGVALPLTAVIYLHASPGEMGLLGAVALLPYLVLSLPAGVWVDRMPYRRLLVTADLVQAGLLGSIPVLAAFGVLRLWQLYAVAVLAGAASLFEAVAAQSFTPRLVSRQQLVPANSALMLSTAAVGTTGSALGGILVSLLTAPLAIAVDAVSFLAAALCKSRIRTPGLSAAPARAGRRHLRGDIADGLRAVFGHPVVRPAMTAATVGAFGGQVQGVVLILFLVRGAGLPAALVGVVIAVGGVAAVAGATLAPPLTARLGPGPAFITGMLIASVAGIVLACAFPPLPLALPVLVAAQLLRGAGPPVCTASTSRSSGRPCSPPVCCPGPMRAGGSWCTGRRCSGRCSAASSGRCWGSGRRCSSAVPSCWPVWRSPGVRPCGRCECCPVRQPAAKRLAARRPPPRYGAQGGWLVTRAPRPACPAALRHCLAGGP